MLPAFRRLEGDVELRRIGERSLRRQLHMIRGWRVEGAHPAEREPEGRRESGLGRRRPQRDDVHPAIGDAVCAARQQERADGGGISPRIHPRADAPFERGLDGERHTRGGAELFVGLGRGRSDHQRYSVAHRAPPSRGSVRRRGRAPAQSGRWQWRRQTRPGTDFSQRAGGRLRMIAASIQLSSLAFSVRGPQAPPYPGGRYRFIGNIVLH